MASGKQIEGEKSCGETRISIEGMATQVKAEAADDNLMKLGLGGGGVGGRENGDQISQKEIRSGKLNRERLGHWYTFAVWRERSKGYG